MNATVIENAIDAVTAQYTIEKTIMGDYLVRRDGVLLTGPSGTRFFMSRASARKRIHRERTGNFHS